MDNPDGLLDLSHVSSNPETDSVKYALSRESAGGSTIDISCGSMTIGAIEEPLFIEETDRNTILPIRYPEIWKNYKLQEASVWHAHEVRLEDDWKDWEKLTSDEKHFLKMILAFFATSDIIINENLEERFKQEIKVLEAKFAYAFQTSMENIHSEMYSLLIDTYIKDPKEKDHLFNAVKNIPIIAEMAAWTRKWIEDKESSFAERLIAISCVEGIIFSGAFCAIFWLKERGLLPGLAKSNELISRDEGLHVELAQILYSTLKEKCSTPRAHQIIAEARDLAVKFITAALPCKLIGMNSNLMTEYVTYIANRMCKEYGIAELYPNSKQPFTFMDRIGLSSKGNFFEVRISQYNKADNNKYAENEDPFEF
jgi:ribonucleotide reductase beta subunit family protein with ferritin-like domain